MIRFFIIFLSTIPLLNAVPGEPILKPETDYHSLVNNFFEELKGSKPGQTLSDLMNTNPTMFGRESVEIPLCVKFESAMGDHYSLQEYDIVKDVLISPHIVSVSGFANFDKGPIVIEFVFFKLKDKWVFYNFTFSTDIMPFVKDYRTSSGGNDKQANSASATDPK